MTVIPTGFAQINFVFGGAAAPNGAEVTLGADVSGYTGSPTDLAEEARDLWIAEMLGGQSNGTQLVRVDVKFGPAITGPSGSATAANNGTGGADAATPNVTYLIRKSTAFGGRAGSGRMYVPGVTETSVDGAGAVASGTRTFFANAINELAAGLTVAGAPPVLLHGAQSPLAAPSPITGFTVDPRVATQRRRLRR